MRGGGRSRDATLYGLCTHLQQFTDAHGEERPIWREATRGNRRLERHPVKHALVPHVYKLRASILIGKGGQTASVGS